MKYSVSIRQNDDTLTLADEIYLEYKDINGIYRVSEKFPDKDYVIGIYTLEEVDWNELKALNDKLNLTIMGSNLSIFNRCRQEGLKFFSGFNITTYVELREAINAGVTQVKIGAPLYFDLKAVRIVVGDKIKIRINANGGSDTLFNDIDRYRMAFILPRDVDLYDEFVDVITFISDNVSTERALLKIYKIDKDWKGNLKLIIHNFNKNVDTRAIPEEFGQARIQCRQNCMRTGGCRFCSSAIDFADAINKKVMS